MPISFKRDCIAIDDNDNELLTVHDHWLIMVSYDPKEVDVEKFGFSHELGSIMYKIECDLPKNCEIAAAVIKPLQDWLKVHLTGKKTFKK